MDRITFERLDFQSQQDYILFLKERGRIPETFRVQHYWKLHDEDQRQIWWDRVHSDGLGMFQVHQNLGEEEIVFEQEVLLNVSL